MKEKNDEEKLLFKIKAITIFYMLVLIFFGVTAFPIESELKIVCEILGISQGVSPDHYEGFKQWIALVNEGVVNTNRDYPFIMYGVDWLAFSHLAIAASFIGLYRKPVRNVWIVYFAMIACIGVIPLAIICGPIRGIPFYWTLIDSSFCLFGLIPLYFLHVYIKRLEKLIGYVPSKY
ncbi:MAG: hypothetical protein QM660_06770 [Dysgonomonas sp.]